MPTRPTPFAPAAAAGLLCLAAIAAAAPKAGFEAAYPAAPLLAKSVGRGADAALATAAAGHFDAARAQAQAAFALAATYGTARDADAFREAAFARRLIVQVGESDAAARGDLFAYLLAHPAQAHTLAFAVHDGDDVPAVYALFDRLRRQRPAQVDRFPELAAALCVVRDKPLTRSLNENTVTAADPLALFDFFAAHDRQMSFGLRGVPVELLCYVVDTTAGVDEMTWAANKYAGTRDVGSLFFTIAYDDAYFIGKAEKKVDTAPGGYGLPNILSCGGVCIDQAYFATSVGKAIGVPTALATAASADAGHAWVGFLKGGLLKGAGTGAAWDFNAGRYDAYQGLRGDVTDPQTGATLADSTVALLGDLIGTNPTQRQDAAAMIDAAHVQAASADPPADPPVDPPAYPADAVPPRRAFTPPPPRPATAEGQLQLVEMGLSQFAADPRGWAVVADLARAGQLSESQKHRWADLTERMCGAKHPDFALSILTPMVDTVANPAEAAALWDAVFNFVKARPDLAAEVRFRQAATWERAHDLPRAGQCYEDVVHRYLNAGPFALRAVKGAEAVLRQMHQDRRVLDLYAAAVKAVARPSLAARAEFMHESNWYKLREAYADQLAAAGQQQQADVIHAQDKQGGVAAGPR